MQTFNPLGVHLHANFQPTWQNWTGTLSHQLCCANAAEVCRLTFRPDPQFARELATPPQKFALKLSTAPHKFACKLSHLRAKVCMQTSNPPRKFARNLLEVCMQTFTALCGMSSKSTLKTKELPLKNMLNHLQLVSVSSGGMSGQPALSFGQGLSSIKTRCSISAAVLSLDGKNTK